MELDLQRRVAAAQATRDCFVDRPFNWGTEDCAQMVAFHLRQLGIRPKIAKAGSYDSAVGAQAALRRLGVSSLSELADKKFKRVAPAAAWVGDLIQIPGDHDIGALFVVLGNGRVLGYHEDAVGAAVLQPVQFTAAWRVRV